MKMKKLVALISAGVLCLSMSMTAFATEVEDKDPSPQDPPKTEKPVDPPKTDEEIRKEMEKEYNEGLTVVEAVWFSSELEYDVMPGYLSDAKKDLTEEQYKEVVDTLSDPEKIEDVIKAACNLPNDVQCALMKTGDIRYGEYDENGNWIDKPIPAGGIDIQVSVGSASEQGLKNGDSIYVLHYVNGRWEVLEGIVELYGDDARVTVHFTSLSPVAYVKVTSNGKVVPYNAKGEPVTPVKTKSPRTGE